MLRMLYTSYPHKVAALYPHRAAAEAAVNALYAAELGEVRLFRLAPGQGEAQALRPRSAADRDARLADSVARAAVGATLAGAAPTAPTLFVSAPIVGPLIVLGYGAMVGGTPGAIRGVKLHENVLGGLVKDALEAGYHVVIVQAANREAQRLAEAVIDSTMVEEKAHA